MPQLNFKPGEKEAIERRQQSVYEHPLFQRQGFEPINLRAITENIVPDIFQKSPPFSPAAGGASALGALAAIPAKGKAVGEALAGLGKAGSKLSHDELFANFKSGLPGAEEALVQNVLLPMAYKAASRFKGRGVDSEDIAQQSVMKGLEAARAWKTKGSNAPLPGYLKTSIDRSTDELIRTSADVPIPQKEYRDVRKIGQAASKLKSTASTAEPEWVGTRGVTTPRVAGEEPGILSVSRKTGLPAVKVKEIMGRENTPNTIDFEDLANVDPAKLSATLGGLSPESSSEIAKRMMEAGLTERQLRAVKLSMGLEGEPMSVRNIAKEIGVASPNAVQSQLKAAMAKLKKAGRPAEGETPELAPKGSDWYQRAAAQNKTLEERTGAKTELGESQLPMKPAPPISGGSTGTVFDQVRENLDKTDPTWRDQLKKGGSGPGGSSINNPLLGVQNPEHPIFQLLQERFPKLALALQRMNPEKGQIPMKFTDQTPDWYKQMNAYGATRPGLGPNNPTLMSVQPNLKWADTEPHEALHALYAGKRVDPPNPPAWSAMDILKGTIGKRNPVYAERLLEHYAMQGQPLEHGALEGMAVNMTDKAGLPFKLRAPIE